MGIISLMCRKESVLFSLFGVGAGTYLVMISSNTYFGKYYQNYWQKYGPDGKPVEVKQRLDFQFRSVVQDMGFTEWNSKYITLFINKSLDPMGFGSSESRYGMWIGLPEFFQQSTEEGIMSTNILIDKKPVKWDSADGEQLLQSLMLSNDAKKFVMAHQLAIYNSNYIQFKAALPLVMTCGAAGVGEMAYRKLKLEHRPFVLTILVGLLTATVFVLLQLFMNDALFFLYDKGAEDRVATFGASYIKGGIEYYEKRIERCKALRNLEAKGPKYYSVGGNEINIWRASSMPNTVRLNLMKHRLEDFAVIDDIKPGPVNPNPHPIF